MMWTSGTPYEFISEFPKLAALGSFREGTGDTFAPPIVVDGETVISQSVACCWYLAKKLGLLPPDECKGLQYLLDIQDVFENSLGKHNEQGPALKKFLEGGRWEKLMANLERSIKGPYYFGAEPCVCDFFLLGILDWRGVTFDKLKAKHGFDAMAAFPKAAGVAAKLRLTDAYVGYKGGLTCGSGAKDEVIDAYHD